MSRAFAAACGVENLMDGVSLAGRTDTVVLAEVLARFGIGAAPALVAHFQSAYFGALEEELTRRPDGARLLPGVAHLLDRLIERPATTVALLTGNYSTGARLKLEHFGIWSYFPFGAFGEDASDRDGLVPVAVGRGLARGMPAVEPRDVIVVGDTELDVACGRANGATTVAVATGGSPADALSAAGADLVLDDFSDPEPFLDFLDRGR
jgi:phosphoglycolate phosphatase